MKSDMSRGTGNCLLDRLTAEEYARLARDAKRINRSCGHVLWVAGAPAPQLYFPVSSVCSTLIQLGDGLEVETVPTGREGVLGCDAFLGLRFSLYRAVVQISGDVIAVPASTFQAVLKLGGALDGLMRRYMAFRLRATEQILACNARHPLAHRLCRWLLAAQDAVGENHFELTHEGLANALAVRRQSVSVAALQLQRTGTIYYKRGKMTIRDRQTLESCGCECYRVIRDLYHRIMLQECPTPASSRINSLSRKSDVRNQ